VSERGGSALGIAAPGSPRYLIYWKSERRSFWSIAWTLEWHRRLTVKLKVALAVAEAALGPDHPDTQTYRENLKILIAGKPG